MNLPKQLRAVRVYSFTSCLRLTDAVWVALLAARGFTLAQIGLAEAVFHLTSLLCEVPSGVAADLRAGVVRQRPRCGQRQQCEQRHGQEGVTEVVQGRRHRVVVQRRGRL